MRSHHKGKEQRLRTTLTSFQFIRFYIGKHQLSFFGGAVSSFEGKSIAKPQKPLYLLSLVLEQQTLKTRGGSEFIRGEEVQTVGLVDHTSNFQFVKPRLYS